MFACRYCARGLRQLHKAIVFAPKHWSLFPFGSSKGSTLGGVGRTVRGSVVLNRTADDPALLKFSSLSRSSLCYSAVRLCCCLLQMESRPPPQRRYPPLFSQGRFTALPDRCCMTECRHTHHSNLLIIISCLLGRRAAHRVAATTYILSPPQSHQLPSSNFVPSHQHPPSPFQPLLPPRSHRLNRCTPKPRIEHSPITFLLRSCSPHLRHIWTR